MTYKIAVLPGDGIGPEVVEQAVRVLDATGLSFDYKYAEIGYACYERTGESLPQRTLETIMESDSALFGAVTTPTDIEGYKSPILQLRRELELYANLRPSRSWPHPRSRPCIDIIIVRENTEGLYSGRERMEDDGDTALAERVITRNGSERIAKYAFEYAQNHGRKKVQAVHKANVLRKTCGLFLEAFYDTAKYYPEIESSDSIVDATAMQIVREPEKFDVIVTTNLFGDILSDIAAEVGGGIGLSASGNIGKDNHVFEPVHGSAPNIAGRNIANPIGTMLAGAMMLEHLAEYEASDRIRKAVYHSIKDMRVTPDLGGRLSTLETANSIIQRMRNGE